MGAWHGSGEALGKPPVTLLEKGAGRKTMRWHSFRPLGAAELQNGSPVAILMLLGAWGGGAGKASASLKYSWTPPPRRPPDGSSKGRGSCRGHIGRGQMDGRRVSKPKRERRSRGGQGRSVEKSHVPEAKVHNFVGFRMRVGALERGKGDTRPPRATAKGGGWRRWQPTSTMKGIKVHKREMVRKIILGMAEAM